MVPLTEPRDNGTIKNDIDTGKENMRWAVEYELPSGRFGLCLFAAEDERAAEEYVHTMHTLWGHSNVLNLKELPEGATTENLYKLFPENGLHKAMDTQRLRVGIALNQGELA